MGGAGACEVSARVALVAPLPADRWVSVQVARLSGSLGMVATGPCSVDEIKHCCAHRLVFQIF